MLVNIMVWISCLSSLAWSDLSAFGLSRLISEQSFKARRSSHLGL